MHLTFLHVYTKYKVCMSNSLWDMNTGLPNFLFKSFSLLIEPSWKYESYVFIFCSIIVKISFCNDSCMQILRSIMWNMLTVALGLILCNYYSCFRVTGVKFISLLSLFSNLMHKPSQKAIQYKVLKNFLNKWNGLNWKRYGFRIVLKRFEVTN